MRYPTFPLSVFLSVCVLAAPSHAANKPRGGKSETTKPVWTNDEIEKLRARGLITFFTVPEVVPATPAAATPYDKTKDPMWYAEQAAGTQHPSARRPPAQQYRAQSGAQTGSQSSTKEPSQNEAQVPKPKSAPLATSPRIINSDAWKLLADGAASEKSSQRSDAISAVATVGTESRAVRLVEAALEDKDTGVRILAAMALGEMKSHRSIPRLREVLDDPAGEVQFAAARSLWTMGDYSGEGILVEVLAGERHAGPGVVRGSMNDAKKKLHNPAALALQGVNEAAGALLGPFAMGVSVIEAFAKDNSAPTRALCATLLASDNSPDSIHELEDALGDKNWVVRAAAAKALGNYPRKGVIPKLQEMLQDDKEPVRFMAAASLVRLTKRNVKIVAIARQTLP